MFMHDNPSYPLQSAQIRGSDRVDYTCHPEEDASPPRELLIPGPWHPNFSHLSPFPQSLESLYPKYYEHFCADPEG